MEIANKIKTKPLLILLICLLVIILVWAVFSLPGESNGLQHQVSAQLNQSGVTHAVTAVLLNFRGYDTLLELAVLFLILIGVWSLGFAPSLSPGSPISIDGNPVLMETVRVLIPLLVLVAGYFLWIGAFAPGGAFHAGAILGTAGVLYFLSGNTPAPATQFLAKAGFTIGLLSFVIVGIGVSWLTGIFLQYPTEWAKQLILLIEIAATFSIGLTLAALFLGGRPQAWQENSIRGDLHR